MRWARLHMWVKFKDDWLKTTTCIAEYMTISFKHEYSRPNLMLCCDVISDVINIKSTFSGIICNDLSISDIKITAANKYGIFVFCKEFTCKIREYEFGLQNTEIELCQFCHWKNCGQNKAYLFWVANQSRFVAFYALRPSNTSLITKNIQSSLFHMW